MKSLFLDTSSSRIIIACVEDKNVIFNINLKNDNNLSNRLIVLIDECLKEHKLCVNDINKIYVVNGPGSFTGIRCGVTVAKTMAYLLNIEIACISELEVMSSGYDEIVCPIIDARRGFVYGAIYNGVDNIREDEYILYDDLIKNFNGKVLSYDYENTYAPKVDLIKLIEKHKNNSISPHLVVPNYLKKTEAEENLDAKRN